jgi:hypothetical protein
VTSNMIELQGVSSLTRLQMEAVLKAVLMTLDIDEMRRGDGDESSCRMSKRETSSLRQAYEKMEQAYRLQS